MKKILLASLIFSILFSSRPLVAQEKTSLIYDENVQIRKVGSFNAISVSSAIDLYLTQSNKNEVAVSASNSEIRDQIVAEVVGSTLIIRLGDKGTWFSWKKWGNYKTKAYVSVKDIDAITASGASNVHLVNTIESPKLKIKLTGASDFRGNIKAGVILYNLSGASDLRGEVNANSIDIDASGASHIELAGTVEDLAVEVAGASDAKLYNLTSKGAILNASGASHLSATVTEMLRANSKGASDINYKGSPTVKESNSSGASNIRHRNQFKLKVDKDSKNNELVFVAENLGTEPPNTGVMFITEKSGRRQQVVLSTDMTHNEVIYFIRIEKQQLIKFTHFKLV